MRKRKQAGPKEVVRERREVGRELVYAVRCEEKNERGEKINEATREEVRGNRVGGFD